MTSGRRARDADCFDEDEALRFADGELEAPLREEAARHLEGCAVCRQLVSELARDEAGASGGQPAAGEALGGRYVLGRVLGAGAMGVVYEAYDPELDRKVAIKLLRAGEGDDEVGRQARLRREARVMARVSHPNVVPIYDVGVWRGHVFLAIERVEGGPLSRRLLQLGPGDWRRVLRLFLQAGRGLEAAHRAGLVHRDFKPDNVLVDGEGRARVTDFGLARQSLERGEGAGPSSGLSGRTALAGTPAYMAPEQLRGEGADARSDQYAFCVALYEALYGRRPFEGASVDGLLRSMAAGQRTRPSGRRVPARLGRLLGRGLRFAPSERFASMAELLSLLERAARERPALRAAAALGVAAAVAAAGFSLRARQPSCEGAGAALEGAWGAGRKDAVRRALLASGVPYAEGAFRSVERSLDRYAADWSAMRLDACLSTHVRREQSEGVLRARYACLEQRRFELEALSAELSSPSTDAAEKAVKASQSLSGLRECANGKALLSAGATAGSEGLRRRLASMRVANATDRYAEGLAAGRALVDDARAAGDRVIEAQALESFGRAQLMSGSYDEAERSYLGAYRTADAADLDYVRVEAATDLAFVAACVRGDLKQGRDWVEIGRATVERIGGDQGLEGVVTFMDGTAWACGARYREAIEALGRAARAFEGVPGHERSAVTALKNLAVAMAADDRHVESLGVAERAERLAASTFGPNHPLTCEVTFELALGLDRLGRYDAAHARAEGAARCFADAFGERSRAALRARGLLCLVDANRGKGDEAVACHRAVVAQAEAMPAASRRSFGAPGDLLDELRHGLGAALVEAGRAGEALPLLEALRGEFEGARGREAVFLGFVLASLGKALVEAGRPGEAVAPLERAGQLLEAHGAGPLVAGDRRFDLARALSGKDPARARTLAEDALAGLRSVPGEGAAPLAAKVEAWLRARSAPPKAR